MHGGDGIPLVQKRCCERGAVCDYLHGAGITGVTDALGKLTGVITDGDLRRCLSVVRISCTVLPAA